MWSCASASASASAQDRKVSRVRQDQAGVSTLAGSTDGAAVAASSAVVAAQRPLEREVHVDGLPTKGLDEDAQ